MGALSDRIGKGGDVHAGDLLCGLLGFFFFLGFILGLLVLSLMAIFSSSDWGTPSPAALLRSSTADFFEGRRYGGIFGTLMILNGVGGAAGNWFAASCMTCRRITFSPLL